MSVKVLVRDSNKRPKANVTVFIKWKDGTSTCQTNDSGIADTLVSAGSIEYIDVYGKKLELYGSYYENKTIVFDE